VYVSTAVPQPRKDGFNLADPEAEDEALKCFMAVFVLLCNVTELFLKDIRLFPDQIFAAGESEFPDKKELGKKLKPQISHPLKRRMHPLQECLVSFLGNRIDMLGRTIILLLYGGDDLLGGFQAFEQGIDLTDAGIPGSSQSRGKQRMDFISMPILFHQNAQDYIFLRMFSHT